MKLVGLRLDGAVTVARLEDDGRARPLAPVAEFWADPRGCLSREGAAKTVAADALVPPVPPSARVLCVGLNYRAHVAEGSFRDHPLPEHPTVFGRWTASLSVGDVPVLVPAAEDGLDWEGEVAAYVGAPLHDVDPETARAAILGYSTFNDLTARRTQRLTTQWTLGKNVDASGPLGPLVTADETGDPGDGWRVRTHVNGTLVQDGDTRDMIFDVGRVLSEISATLTLQPGDVIATGTPDGVGYARTPPWLLTGGDVVEVSVDRLGTLRTPVASAAAPTDEHCTERDVAMMAR